VSAVHHIHSLLSVQLSLWLWVLFSFSKKIFHICVAVKLCNREMCASQSGFSLSQLLLIRKLCSLRTSWSILHRHTGLQKTDLVSVGCLQTLNRLIAEWRRVSVHVDISFAVYCFPFMQLIPGNHIIINYTFLPVHQWLCLDGCSLLI